MERNARQTVVNRLVAACILGLICFSVGVHVGVARATKKPDYSAYSRDELSWVQEGIQERISALEDELDRVRELQRDAN